MTVLMTMRVQCLFACQMCNAFGVQFIGGIMDPACAARRRALEFNAYGVGMAYSSDTITALIIGADPSMMLSIVDFALS